MPALLKNNARGAIVAALACAGLGVFAGCGEKTVETGDVQNEITDKLKEQGIEASDAKCPDDMKAKKDETYKCTVKIEGQEREIELRMTNDDGNFEFQLPTS